MNQSHSIKIVSSREVAILVAIALCLGLLGTTITLLGLLPMQTGIAATILLFLLVFLGHVKWRYGPLKTAVSSISAGDFHYAQNLLEQYLSKSFDRMGRSRDLARVLRASCLFYLEEYEEALEISQKVIKSSDCDSIQFFAQCNIASCCICLQKPLKANSERDKILTMSMSKDAKREALINIGLCYLNFEFFKEASETWEEALELSPDNEERAYILGFQSTCANRVRDYTKALEKVSQAKKLSARANLTKAILMDNEAFALANKKEELDKALQLCKDAFALGVPVAEPHLHMTLGEVHYARGEFDLALEELQCSLNKIAKRDKNSHQKAYLTLGKIHQARGNQAEAQEALNQAISIDPSKTLAVHAQQILRDPASYNTAVSSPGQVLQESLKPEKD